MAARKTIDLGSAGRASLAPEGKGVREFLQKPVSWPPCPGKAVGAHLLVNCVCPCDTIAIATAIAMWCRAAVSSFLLTPTRAHCAGPGCGRPYVPSLLAPSHLALRGGLPPLAHRLLCSSPVPESCSSQLVLTATPTNSPAQVPKCIHFSNGYVVVTNTSEADLTGW